VHVSLSTLLFGIRQEEVRCERRGFASSEPMAMRRLEAIGLAFLEGYHAALDLPVGDVAVRLHAVDRDLRGFAFEGAAMGLSLLDSVWLRGGRFAAFLAGPGAAHVFMVHVGAGWAYARLPWVRRNLDAALGRLDPLLRWLAIDGHGFHDGYFHPRDSIRRQIVPRHLTGYARRAYDQGLGRSLWFVEGTDVRRIAASIEGFARTRRSDLWSGAGLACAYAGGRDYDTVSALWNAAGADRPALAQGAAFAAEARRRAGNLTRDTEIACRVFCGMPAEGAADVSVRACHDLPPDGSEPPYEVWRRRIQQSFAARMIPA
jgi:hypothetical protein